MVQLILLTSEKSLFVKVICDQKENIATKRYQNKCMGYMKC